jgi:hypothetical protein
MDEYYTKADDGRWSGLKAPSHDFKKPPTCPTCRSAITSPRYGRVFKRADLDILELNVAARMSQSLIKVQASLESLSKPQMEEALVKEARTIEVADAPYPPKTLKLRKKAQKQVLSEKRDLPVHVDALDPGNKKYHSVSPAVVTVWKKVTQRLIAVYTHTRTVAATRSAHLNAWESAFSCLYRQEMDLAVTNPSQAPRRPREHAMRVAKMRVGQPKPRADKKFLVESFWWSLNLRFILVDLAQIWFRSVGKTAYPLQQCQMWCNFGLFVLNTCEQDSEIAYKIAEESESRRQMTKTYLYIMRAELERFRFNVDILRQNGGMKDERNNLVTSASEKARNAMTRITRTRREHATARGLDEEWLKNNFVDTADMIVDEWKNIERTIRMDTFYQPVSLDEKMLIVRSLGFCESSSLQSRSQ